MTYYVADRYGVLLRTDDLARARTVAVEFRCPVYRAATGEIVVD